jgi:hydroxyacylglutathione hydrolase
VLVLTTQATALETSCYVVAAARGSACLVLDPGAGAYAEVERLVAEHGLRPVSVAATHGHPDHVWDAAAITGRWGVPFFIAAADADRLTDPAAGLGAGLLDAFAALTGSPWRRPESVVPLPTGGRLSAAGVDLGVEIGLLPAAGHTPGSTIFLVEGELAAESVLPPPSTRTGSAGRTLAFTGDVLFAGSIGRVDLPGGDGPTMLRTLKDLRRTIPSDALLLPGHGPTSTMARELTSNPYLDDRWLASAVL